MAEDDQDRANEMEAEHEREVEEELERVDEGMDSAELRQSDAEGLPDEQEHADGEEGDRADGRHVEVEEDTDRA